MAAFCTSNGASAMVAFVEFLLLLPPLLFKECCDNGIILKFTSFSCCVLLVLSPSMITAEMSVLSDQATLPASIEFIASNIAD
jgi:hypothetical protein